MKRILLGMLIFGGLLLAQPAQLPSQGQAVKAAFFGLALGWLAFPGLVAGDMQWVKLNNAGNCDSDHDIKMYMPLPVQYGTDQYWKASVPCDKWPNNNNIPVKD